jgi:hypothetical protein
LDADTHDSPPIVLLDSLQIGQFDATWSIE